METNLPLFSSTPLQTPTHCVFRRGASWLALPATAIREAIPRPKIVSVPATSSAFVGLCHVRSEFIPVLNPDLYVNGGHGPAEEIMLIVDDADGVWALLVDEVSSLRSLEMSDAPEAADDDCSSAVIGWATAGNTVIQVLDPYRLHELASRDLAAEWGAATGSGTERSEGRAEPRVPAGSR